MLLLADASLLELEIALRIFFLFSLWILLVGLRRSSFGSFLLSFSSFASFLLLLFSKARGLLLHPRLFGGSRSLSAAFFLLLHPPPYGHEDD